MVEDSEGLPTLAEQTECRNGWGCPLRSLARFRPRAWLPWL